MFEYLLRASFNPGGRFVILYANLSKDAKRENPTTFAFNLFHLMYDRLNAARVVLLYAVDGNTYNLYGTNPYRNKVNCGKFVRNILRVIIKFKKK